MPLMQLSYQFDEVKHNAPRPQWRRLEHFLFSGKSVNSVNSVNSEQYILGRVSSIQEKKKIIFGLI